MSDSLFLFRCALQVLMMTQKGKKRHAVRLFAYLNIGFASNFLKMFLTFRYTDDGHYLEDGTYDGDYTTDDSFHDEAPRRQAWNSLIFFLASCGLAFKCEMTTIN